MNDLATVAADVAHIRGELERVRDRVHDMAGGVGLAHAHDQDIAELRQAVADHSERDDKRFGDVISEVKRVREDVLSIKTEKRVILTIALLIGG
ncbi:MAG TPA: hypothetical protein VFV05_15580, partial [Methylomirabilota bacterium]|nr:hypothetical protein [Methylomirabilota bacterium]